VLQVREARFDSWLYQKLLMSGVVVNELSRKKKVLKQVSARWSSGKDKVREAGIPSPLAKT
jgi:hypothetical protein